MCMISHVTITSNNHGIIYVHVCVQATTSVQVYMCMYKLYMVSHVTITSNNHGIIYVYGCVQATTSVQVYMCMYKLYMVSRYHYK